MLERAAFSETRIIAARRPPLQQNTLDVLIKFFNSFNKEIVLTIAITAVYKTPSGLFYGNTLIYFTPFQHTVTFSTHS